MWKTHGDMVWCMDVFHLLEQKDGTKKRTKRNKLKFPYILYIMFLFTSWGGSQVPHVCVCVCWRSSTRSSKKANVHSTLKDMSKMGSLETDLDPPTPSNSRLHSIMFLFFVSKGAEVVCFTAIWFIYVFFWDERSTKRHKSFTLDSPHSIVHHSLVECFCIQRNPLKWWYRK